MRHSLKNLLKDLWALVPGFFGEASQMGLECWSNGVMEAEKSAKIVCLTALVMFGGCATSRNEVTLPEASPLGSDIAAYHAPGSERCPKVPVVEEPSGKLTLRQALSLALMKNPELAAYSWETRAAEARILQANVLANPEIELEIEEFGGTGEATGFDVAESSLRLSQLVELGGKRRKRKQAAKLEKDLAEWDYEAKRLDVLTESIKRFLDVLAAQHRLELAEESVGLSKRVYEAAIERVKQGKIAPIEEDRAKVVFSISKIDLEKSKGELALIRKKLAVSWGNTRPKFKEAEGDIYSVAGSIPSFESLVKRGSRNPDILRLQSEMESYRAAVRSEKARAVPDLEVSAGVQRFEESGDSAFVAGVSIPLPVFDRNKGGVRASEDTLAKIENEQRAVNARIHMELLETYNALSLSHLESTTLKKEALPAAKRAFDGVSDGYKRGKFGYLEVLDAQKTLYETRQKHIEALVEYHKAVAGIERLLGRSLELKKND